MYEHPLFFLVQTLNRQVKDCEEQFAKCDKKCLGLELRTSPLGSWGYWYYKPLLYPISLCELIKKNPYLGAFLKPKFLVWMTFRLSEDTLNYSHWDVKGLNKQRVGTDWEYLRKDREWPLCWSSSDILKYLNLWEWTIALSACFQTN